MSHGLFERALASLIVVGLGLLAPACHESAEAPETPICCTASDCEPTGQRCNVESCVCEVIPCGRAPGKADLCPNGTYCKLSSGLTGTCSLSECADFFGGVCASGMKCAPMNSHAYACIANGTGVAGSGCVDDGDCGAGLLCHDELCAAPDCSPRTSAAACSITGHVCDGWARDEEALDVGLCIEPCTAFSSGACGVDEWCFPDHADPANGVIAGRCVADTGSVQVGGDCESDAQCDAGLGCVGPLGLATCRTLCDWNAGPGEIGATCVAPADCVPIARPSGSLEPIGFCSASCRAFTSGECEPGDWCFPDRRDTATGDLFGTCLPGGGTVDRGGSCSAGPGVCADNLVCVGLSATATCRTLCDVEATASTPGATCTGQEFCADLYVDVGGAPVKAVYGACLSGCDYDLQIACVDTSKDCVPGELAASIDDLCVSTPNLPEFGDCTAAGLEEQDYCNATSGCYDFYTAQGPPWCQGVRCYELCRKSVQALGTTHHPDCTRPDALCYGILGTTEFGVCTPLTGDCN